MSLDDPTADPLAAGDAGRRVIRGGGLRAAAHVVGLASGLISAPLVVRHLGVEDFGHFAVVTSVVTIAVALTEGGLTNVAIRRYAVSDEPARASLIANLMGLRVVLSAIAAVLAVLFGVVTGKEGVVVAGLALGGLGILFNNLWGALSTVLVARLRLGSVALLDIVRSSVTTLALVALVVAGSGLLGFYVVAPAVAALAVVVAAFLTRGIAPRRPRADRAEWSALVRETALYAAATALGAVYFQIALVTMSVLADETETGLYSVSFRIVELVNGVPWLLAGSVFPVLAHAAANDPKRLAYAVLRVTEGGLAAGALALVAFVLGAPVAIDVVGGEEAAGAVPVLRLLGIGVLATFLVASWGFVLLSLERYRDLLVINAIALALALGLSVALIPPMGAEGGAIVTATLEVVLAVGYGLAIRRARPGMQPVPAAAARVLLATLAGLGAGALLLGVGALPATLLGLAVCAALLVATGSVPTELRDALRRRAT